MQRKYALAEISVLRRIRLRAKDKFIQENYESVLAIPYDMPIVGYGNHVCQHAAVYGMQRRSQTFRLDEFDRGNYHKAVEQENLAKLIVDVLYPE